MIGGERGQIATSLGKKASGHLEAASPRYLGRCCRKHPCTAGHFLGCPGCLSAHPAPDCPGWVLVLSWPYKDQTGGRSWHFPWVSLFPSPPQISSFHLDSVAHTSSRLSRASLPVHAWLQFYLLCSGHLPPHSLRSYTVQSGPSRRLGGPISFLPPLSYYLTLLTPLARSLTHSLTASTSSSVEASLLLFLFPSPPSHLSTRGGDGRPRLLLA